MRKVMYSLAILASIPVVLVIAALIVSFAVTLERASALDKVWR